MAPAGQTVLTENQGSREAAMCTVIQWVGWGRGCPCPAQAVDPKNQKWFSLKRKDMLSSAFLLFHSAVYVWITEMRELDGAHWGGWPGHGDSRLCFLFVCVTEENCHHRWDICVCKKQPPYPSADWALWEDSVMLRVSRTAGIVIVPKDEGSAAMAPHKVSCGPEKMT